MTLLRAQASLQRLSGLPEDKYVNTFYFLIPGTGEPTSAQLDDVGTAVAGFYNGSTAGGQQVGQFLSLLLQAGQVHETKVYNMNHTIPRAPVRTSTFSIAEATGAPLPSEVALCLSYRAPLVSGTDPRNRRGRLYIGPLDVGSISGSITNSDALPNVSLQNAMRDAAQRLMDLTTLTWVVYSPTNATAYEIVNAHVDNAFDTQRRRGGKPTSRVSANKSAV